MHHLPFEEFGSAFNHLPRRLDDLRERETDGSFLPRQNVLPSIMIGISIWLFVLAIEELNFSVNGPLAAVSASLATQPSAAQLAHRR